MDKNKFLAEALKMLPKGKLEEIIEQARKMGIPEEQIKQGINLINLVKDSE